MNCNTPISTASAGVKLACISVLAILTTTCWNGYGNNPEHSFKQPVEFGLGATNASSLQLIWDFQIPTFGFSASPSVYDNTVYIGGLNGIFYAIYANGPNQGRLRWKYPPDVAPNPIDACGTTTSPLQSSAPGSGANPSGPGIASSAAIVPGVAGHTAVIFGAPDPNTNGGDGRVWALDAFNGRCIWKSPVIAASVIRFGSKIGYSSPAIAHGRAYVGTASLVADHPVNTGKVFSIILDTGLIDTTFSFVAAGPPPDLPALAGEAGGGVWSSPAVDLESGNVIVTTGNSCRSSMPSSCPLSIPSPDYTQSMVELDWHTGHVLWQFQPVDIHWDHDCDFGASAIVAHASCGTMAISIQKDGFVHAVDISPVPNPNQACSYPDHNLVCPRWSFPTTPLPFQEDGHGDTFFIRTGALDGDHLFITAGGLDLTAYSPTDPNRFRSTQLHSLDLCRSDANRIRWVLRDLDGVAGVPSVANGVIYLGTDRGGFYAIADIDTVTPTEFTCAIPFGGGGLPPGRLCRLFGYPYVPIPVILKHLSLTGSIIGAPAIAQGQIFVATKSGIGVGHVYALEAVSCRGPTC